MDTETNPHPGAEDHKQVEFSVALSTDLTTTKKTKVKPTDLMSDVLAEGAKRFKVDLRPTSEDPLDRLLTVTGGTLGSVIDLNLTADEYANSTAEREVAIELVLAIRVNKTWKEATAAQMSPKEILALFELPFDQYTLYNPGADAALPLDVPIALTRGQGFEAQKDGKYGEGPRRAGR